MATFTKFQPFVDNIMKAKIDFTNDGSAGLTIFLCATASAPSNTYSTLSQVTQISYTNLSSRTLAISSSSQTGGTYTLKITDKVLSASGGSVAAFQYVGIYAEASASDYLVGFYDYGTAVTLNDGDTFTCNFDETNGVLQLT